MSIYKQALIAALSILSVWARTLRLSDFFGTPSLSLSEQFDDRLSCFSHKLLSVQICAPHVKHESLIPTQTFIHTYWSHRASKISQRVFFFYKRPV